MKFYIKLFVLISVLSLMRSHTHDEISKCSLAGVHKTRQTTIESPNYPNNYDANSCWDYVIRAPYKCPTTFHIQFLDFYLEYSKNCKNDYLAIGLQNVDDDMDVLCGQVVGIKKYHTPDGILRLRFFADVSPWTTGKGFKLLVTRLACETDGLFRQNDHDSVDSDTHDNNDNDDNNDDTIAVAAPSENFQPPESELKQIFRNLTGQEQYQIVTRPPLFGFNYSPQLPSPPYPATGIVYAPSGHSQSSFPNYSGSYLHNNFQQPCATDNEQKRQHHYLPNYFEALSGNQLPHYPNNLGGNEQNLYFASNNANGVQHPQAVLLPSDSKRLFSNSRDQFVAGWSSTPNRLRAYDNTIDLLEACCVAAFQQKHFYLSSPGFPRTILSNILPNSQKQDCVFRIQKSSSNICSLRLNFKFFDFGQSYQGTGSYAGNIGQPAIQNTQDVCQENFIEIDNQRFCGCRSGYTFTAYWTTAADKKLRMRIGYSDVPTGGFLLDLVQEECSETQMHWMTTDRPPAVSISTSTQPNILSDHLINPLQAQQTLLGQHQQNVYGDSYTTQQQHQQQQQNSNAGPYGGNYQGQQAFLQNRQQHTNKLGQQQQLPHISSATGNNLQQQNPFLTQHMQQLQSPNTNNLYPSQFGSNYFYYPTLQNLPPHFLQQEGFPTSSFALAQIRYPRSYGDQQPVTVVETNSTRKEFYYGDNDSFHYNPDSFQAMSRSSSAEISSQWDRKDTNVNERDESTTNVVQQRRKCSFDVGDILRLSIDILWITKPICYAAQRNWFTNWIG